jgi:hypothetical protein
MKLIRVLCCTALLALAAANPFVYHEVHKYGISDNTGDDVVINDPLFAPEASCSGTISMGVILETNTFT